MSMTYIFHAVKQVVIPFWYNGWLVALADIIAGCFVLTSLARQDVKHTSAKLIAVSTNSQSPKHGVAMHVADYTSRVSASAEA